MDLAKHIVEHEALGITEQDIETEKNGFSDRLAEISFDNSTKTFTISGSHTFFNQGIEVTKTLETVQIEDTDGVWIIYYDSSNELTASQVWPGFNVPLVATVFWNKTLQKGLLADERHGYIMDEMTHAYLHQTVGVRYASGLSGSFTNSTFSISSGVIWDEDIEFSIAEQTACNILYKDGSSVYKWLENQTSYFTGNYNNGNTLTPVPSNEYYAVWIFATNSPVRPIVALIGQRVDVTLAAARENNKYESLSLGTLPFKEMKLLYRVILRNDATPYEETQDLRNISNLPAGTYVATDHGALTGLNDPDHPASAITVDTTNFAKNLTPADDTVQKALETIDSLASSGGSGDIDGGSFFDTYINTADIDGGTF